MIIQSQVLNNKSVISAKSQSLNSCDTDFDSVERKRHDRSEPAGTASNFFNYLDSFGISAGTRRLHFHL